MAKKGDVLIEFSFEDQIDLLNEVLEKYIDKSKSRRIMNTGTLPIYEFYFKCSGKFIITIYHEPGNIASARMFCNDIQHRAEILKYINDIPAAANKLLARIKQKNIDEINGLNSDVKMLLDTIDAYKKENNQIDNLLAGQN